MDLCLKVLLAPAYRSTDFDVHKNWLEITSSRPPHQWYDDVPGQSEWTLDYPPAFALVEAVLAKIFALTTTNDVLFQRGSVIFLQALTLRPLLSFNAALIMVDNIHFQYNGFFLGVLAFSLDALDRGNYILAAFWFSLLLTLKHLFLTLAPFFTIHILVRYVRGSPRRFAKVAVATLATVCLGLAPTLLPAAVEGVFFDTLLKLKARLFPFDSRGLVHSYWAPNFWALYAFLDRLVLRAAGGGGGGGNVVGSTRGRVDAEAGGMAALPQPTPLVCAILTLIAMAPALAASRAGDPLKAAFHCALSAFIFGWHVHEKFALVALLPLAMRIPDRPLCRHFSRLCAFAVLPLMPQTEFVTAILLIALEEAYHFPLLFNFSFLERLHVSALLALVFLHRLAWPFLLPAQFAAKFEFLPLMLISVYGALSFAAIWLHSCRSFLLLQKNILFPS
ncbi:hypothetical protein CTAYLR_007942 [Chrysophaeum taylorii]|uniref:Alpha-1,3-glucosyltransferase n=1 Tax=Chrysophaeum taylorii TaxID=2483200 RepID=A0AAD7UMN2_9STRA|nr:hypothetical protein CTAYLR_007942 [Chrysophaeum taylorii]